jgi:hypothetical protein
MALVKIVKQDRGKDLQNRFLAGRVRQVLGYKFRTGSREDTQDRLYTR